MKYTLKAILVMALGCLTYSCLDLDPKDQIADGNYWQEASDFKLFANQFYGWTRDFSNSVYDAPHSDKRSDLILDKSGTNVYSNGTNSIPTGDNNYTDNYNRIRRTNILLQKAESYGNQSDIEQYIGEAKFFRAYCYFELLQLYGDVIITKKPLDVTDPEMKVARNDRSEVVDFMIQDLKDAAGQLPLTSAVENGRVGSEGAWAFLSRVALYEGTWQKFRGNEARGKELLDVAAKAAKEVINSKNFSLYTPAILGDSAQKYMFILEDVKSNPAGLLKASNTEYIFSRRHDETLNPIGKNITKECLANAQQIAQKFAALYLCQDGLPIEKSSFICLRWMESLLMNIRTATTVCFIPCVCRAVIIGVMKTPVSTGRVMLPTRLRLLSKGIRLLMVVATLIRNGRRNGRCKPTVKATIIR